jgi:hypothetical protein
MDQYFYDKAYPLDEPYKDIGLFLWKGGLHKAANYCGIKPKFHCAVLTK